MCGTATGQCCRCSNHICPFMGPNGGSVAIDSACTYLDPTIYCKIFQNLSNFPEDCALAASPHVRYRDRSVLPLVLALVFLALAIACLTVLYLLLRYRRRRRRENDEERSPSPRRRRHFAYSPRYLPAFCFKLRYVVLPVINAYSVFVFLRGILFFIFYFYVYDIQHCFIC
jgi:hypothetical protein